MLKDILRKARAEGLGERLPSELEGSYALEVHDSKGRQVGLIAVFGDEVVSLYVPREKLDSDVMEKIKSAVPFTSKGAVGLEMAKSLFRDYGGVEFKEV